MADLSDVTSYLYGVVAAAVYPLGSTQPSIAAVDCRIFEGWPMPDQLDRDMSATMLTGSPPRVVARAGGPVVNVSIYPMQGLGTTIPQILDKTHLISPPVYGLTVSLVDNTLTVSGQPTEGEYITLVADDLHVFSQTGATTSELIAALAAQATISYPSGVLSTATTLTIPVGHKLIVRQGAVGVLGRVTHRQRQSIMITVWAPTHGARNAIAGAIDVAIKLKNKVTLQDGSQALVLYNRTNTSDELQTTTIYRRDLIYDVEYATLEQFPGYVITTVNTTIASLNGAASANALT